MQVLKKGALQDRRASSSSAGKRVQVPLAQTGEGIKECELISWSVQVALLEHKRVKKYAVFYLSCRVSSDTL